jgi:hypothetical protein
MDTVHFMQAVNMANLKVDKDRKNGWNQVLLFG